MEACVIWLDSEHANIFRVLESGVLKHSVKAKSTINPHSSNHDLRKKHSLEEYFKEIVLKLGQIDDLLIFGPGQAKHHFKHYLENHNLEISKKIIGFETLDSLSDNKILEESRKFFKKYNLYHTQV